MGKYQKVVDRSSGRKVKIYVLDEGERAALIAENEELHERQKNLKHN